MLIVALAGAAGIASAHGIAGSDAAFVASSRGAHILPFIYLGAKHMVTGYDHLLFVVGVIFFLYRLCSLRCCLPNSATTRRGWGKRRAC